MTTIAVEVEGLHIPSGVVRTLRFASADFTTTPADIPPDAYFEGRIGEAGPGLARTMFEESGTYGATQVSYGLVSLLNIDGGLDALATDYAFDGRRIEIRTGEIGTPYSGWSVSMVGSMETPQTEGTTIGLVMRDRLVDLDTWVRPTYAGTNVGGAGVEGTADDLKGQVRPRCYGVNANVSPRYVNNVQWIYDVSDLPCVVTAAYDNGVLLTRGTDYASLVDLQATAPTAGTFRAFAGRFRLGSRAVGTVTADVETVDRSATLLLRDVALDAGIVPADISSDAIENDAPLGVFASGDASPRELMDQIARSVGAWYGFDRLGKLRMGRLAVPAGEPLRTWQSYSALDLQLRRRVAPVRKVTVRYGRNNTVQRGLMTSVEGTAREVWLREEYRSAEANALGSVLDAWPNAGELTIDTGLVTQAAAQALADRLLALHGVPRRMVVFDLPLEDLGGVDLGDLVGVDTPRFSLAGETLALIGMDAGSGALRAQVVLWG